MTAAPMSTCPDDNRLVEYVEGLLSAGELRTIDEHVDRCAACRQLLARFAVGSQRDADAEPFASPPLLDGEIAGRYEIVAVIGTGAMSIVYAAYDRVLDRKVALKVLREPNPAQTSRLAREARAMAKLTHPNVVPVYDIGTVHGRMFLTAELISGQTVGEWMQTMRPWREVVEVFVQAGRGLIAAHAAEITHRDFKPSNVLIGHDGRVRITDFGLASGMAPAPGDLRTLTRTGELIGTPVYMAPEQLRGEVADPRSDQFAFCVSLFEALHGARPFPASSLGGLISALERGARSPSRQPVPERVERVLTRGLSLAPAGRATSMVDVVAELEAALATRDATTVPSASPRGRRLVAVGAVGAIGVLGAIAAIIVGTSDRDAPPPAVTPSPTLVATVAVDAEVPDTSSPAGLASGRDAGLTARDAATGTSAMHTRDARTEREAPPPSRTNKLHPIDPAHLPAVQAAFARLGYHGVSFDDDTATEEDIAQVRRRLDAVPNDDRRSAVKLYFALGATQRKLGDCRGAIASFDAAHKETWAIIDAAPGPIDRGFAIWNQRAHFARALCKFALGDPDAVAALRHPQVGRGDTLFEVRLAIGILDYEMGHVDSGLAGLRDVELRGDEATRRTLRTWATATGVR